MDVFNLRSKLVADYDNYMRGFMHIRDHRINEAANKALKDGLLWPDPLIQLNPSFLPGASVDALADEGVIHDECRRVFRDKKDSIPGGLPMTLHTHQLEAVRSANTVKNYVLTTGTGSGKSLSYIVPIIDHVIRNGTGKGIQAIVVYPMNALANSQCGELEKFVRHGYPEGEYPVSYERYTGQESEAEKTAIRTNPPDILLTNYVMLELMLTRPEESKSLVKSAKNLRFLVLDELHTYRGRQGADVALLIRRLRERLNADSLICVGTSATLSSAGTHEEQQREIASVATRLFGADVKHENVIGETLRRETAEPDFSNKETLNVLQRRITDAAPFPTTYRAFIEDPLIAWMESTFGIAADDTGRLVRQTPTSIRGTHGADQKLAGLSGLDREVCARQIEDALLAGYKCDPNPETGKNPFAFRLHQFLSRGDTVYASLEGAEERYLTVHGQQFVPGRKGDLLFPLVFCRECGHEFYCGRKVETQEGEIRFESRPFDEKPEDKDERGNYGYLFFCEENPWPTSLEEVLTRLPDDWSEEFQGGRRIKKDRKSYLPTYFDVRPDGSVGTDGFPCHFITSPFRFCPNCGVAYDAHQRTDYPKLGMLGSDGRSTATTILCLTAILSLQTEPTLDKVARKLLSFTDNRQDASLQAGHFNDFMETSLVRAAIYSALAEAGEEGLSCEQVPQRVFKALNLPPELYLRQPDVKYAARESADRAFRDVLAYRIYRDLKRGWRILSPNLEQLGLLQIEYKSLRDLCSNPEDWKGTHDALATASPTTREEIATALLDFLRRSLAIDVEALNPQFHERLKSQTYNVLIDPWAVDEDEKLEYATIAYPYAQNRDSTRQAIYLSARGRFGRYLRQSGRFPDFPNAISLDEAQKIIQDLFRAMDSAGLVRSAAEPLKGQELPGYQVPATCLCWKAGDGGQSFVDPLRTLVASDVGAKPSPFFQRFYRQIAPGAKGIEAHEHTAQVPSAIREDREKEFREGKLPILFCSPTMELGVDIAQLNVVNMRNVPPTPANYAQRSGRAGRSGQPALVFTYCALGSPHDQYFFNRPQDMVKGAVLPPRIDLANEDLIKSHVHAIWLAETGESLGSSLKEVLDVDAEEPNLDLRQRFVDALNNQSIKERAAARAVRVLASIEPELLASDWYSSTWLGEAVMQPIGRSFERACERWKSLYRSALAQMREQSKVIESPARSAQDKKRAKGLRREAEAQHELLVQASSSVHADFYSYRYFASEGFLPGYSFPRLPLSAYIPGRQGSRSRDDFLNRPRFLAISEFGPRAHIYHEGSRYEVNKVILPARDGDELETSKAKVCPHCGYLHEISESRSADVCDLCGLELGAALSSLFRLQNVSARRRERISSDEEERLRIGYQIKSSIRFANRGDGPSYRVSEVKAPDGGIRFRLLYGQAATIWRINCGWRRRKDYGKMGFTLDTERGLWEKGSDPGTDTQDEGDQPSSCKKEVIPYVEDRKNCLIIEPSVTLKQEEMATLQAALKSAIQIRFQLEDNELAAEALPDAADRKRILLYESAEGGAGVLRQLLEPDALPDVARVALRICHFDEESGEDLHARDGNPEPCEAACYKCLLSYSNQPDHKLLDRFKVLPWLTLLRDSTVLSSPTIVPRSRHLEDLKGCCESGLERKWLDFLQASGCNLPDKAQVYIEDCRTRPDFLYSSNTSAAIYVDGPPHDYPDRQQRDAAQEECLLNASYIVIRFHHQDDWAKILRMHPSIFGGSP